MTAGQSQQETPTPPAQFVCPLTKEIMTQPVMTKYGHCFEKKALVKWLNRNNTCPLTHQELSLPDVISYRSLEQQIIGWKKLHGVADAAADVGRQEPVLIAGNHKMLAQRRDDRMVEQVLDLMQQQNGSPKSGKKNKDKSMSLTKMVRKTLLGKKEQSASAA
ncbi:Putative E3 ubiquitin-protein ligase LIN [Seminavis robusta]|uniref:E3 ubiquitin-protein ligase LIN n=1 Tax=Seminavis robusta TaxID=568900 RepID=A0A9N8DMG1_9STRA|nr:Putative E3 ubiquitin-protein ligase LIN [Seminavis robusta]|eukprot:Sro214_g088770.1 Putative E3 ubiquitin-protein ligase LIN (162) ;mRNA; r:53812-54297